MQCCLKIVVLFTIALSFNESQAVTYLPHTQTLNEASTEYSVDASYFQTTIHANSDAELVELQDGESFNQIESNVWAKYGFTPNLQLAAGVRFRYMSGTITSDEAQSFSNSGMESYLVSVRYSFKRIESMQYALEGNYGQTTYNNAEIDDPTDGTSVVMGDEGQSVSVGFSASYLTEGQNFFSGRFLFRNPSQELSSELVTELEFAMVYSTLSLYAGIENVTSLRQDPYSEDPENKPIKLTQSTYLYNSINRQWTAPYVGGVLSLGKNWRVEYKLMSYLVGTSTDLGMKHMVTLYRRTGGVDVYKQLNQSFKEYTIEANITKVSKNKSSVIIDAGLESGMAKGMKGDFYYFDYLGGNELIASGYVIKANSGKSMIKITRRFSKRKVGEKTIARAGLITQ